MAAGGRLPLELRGRALRECADAGGPGTAASLSCSPVLREANVRAQFRDQRLRSNVNWRDVDGARDVEALVPISGLGCKVRALALWQASWGFQG